MSTLVHRAESLVTNAKGKKEEIEHVKSALFANGYPEWIFQISTKEAKPPASSSKGEPLNQCVFTLRERNIVNFTADLQILSQALQLTTAATSRVNSARKTTLARLPERLVSGLKNTNHAELLLFLSTAEQRDITSVHTT